MEHTTGNTLLLPFLVYGIAVVLLVCAMLVISYFLGEKHEESATDEVFESGIKVTGSARLLFPIHFYVIAMFFVIFDLEAVFILSWAIAIRAVGWAGYIGILVFNGVLVSVLIYEWRIGALDFGPSGKKILRAYYKKIHKNGYHEVVDHQSE
jgi:NADH-quinone oxidoreductase subunit A